VLDKNKNRKWSVLPEEILDKTEAFLERSWRKSFAHLTAQFGTITGICSHNKQTYAIASVYDNHCLETHQSLNWC